MNISFSSRTAQFLIRIFLIVSISLNNYTTPTTVAQVFIDDTIDNIFKENIQFTKACSVPAHIPTELKNVFYQATQNIPCNLLQTLERVEIFEDNTKTLPRAMANARILKVRKDAINDKEIVNVLIHELGHVVDLGGLQGTYSPETNNISAFHDGALQFYNNDLSLLFYKISWTPKSPRADSNRLDFVGGYAQYDMFEDFAESFLLYIRHGKYFKALALQNKKLRSKYLFFKYYVFKGKEFETGTIPQNLFVRQWDITRL